MSGSLVCWNCGRSLEDLPLPLSRHANCPACFEVLHCCRLCRHFSPPRAGQCDHERADPPVNKETANFCDYFKPRRNAYERKAGERHSVARSRLDALFDAPQSDPVPPPEPETKENRARTALDDLFGD